MSTKKWKAGVTRHVLEHLSPDLLRKEFRGNSCPVAGHCYVTAETAYHLFAKPLGYKPCQIKHEGVSHWFLRNKQGDILDLTAEQFETPVPYEKAISKGFLTKQPSKRAQILMQRVLGE